MPYIPTLKVLSVAALIVVAGAACASGAAPADEQKLTGTLQNVSGSLDKTNAAASALASAESSTEEAAKNADAQAGLLALDQSRAGVSRAKFLPNAPKGQVTVQLLGEAVNGDIPGAFAFNLAAPGAKLFTTESLPAGQTFPVGDELKNGIAFVDPGKFYMLEVVYRNPTDQDIKFLTTAPTLDPQAALPFARARCWCAALPFSAPAHGTFHRTIQVGVAQNTPAGAKAIVVWPVVRLPS